MSQKTYLTILKAGVWLTFLSFFLTFKAFLFPFITSKQVYFNILIEVLFVVWLAFIIKYPGYAKRVVTEPSKITVGLVAFFLALLLSTIFSIDFNLSFWGDTERMLGWFHLVHFLVFYLIVITVMRSWKDWKIVFIISLVSAVIISIYGLTGIHYSTIGNTAYVSGLLIFNFYFAFLLFFKEKHKGLRWIYLISVPIMLLEFKKANTSGAIVGLGFSMIVLFLLLALLAKNKKVKIYTFSLFLIFVIATTFIFANKDSDFVKNNSVLKVANQISFQKNTFQTRLISWRAAGKEFKNNPILGIGHGNYAVIFDKHFDPKFYGFTRVETYFDRAHNNLIDIVATAGLVGLLSYLSIFVFTAYCLIKVFRDNKISLIEFSLIFSLFVAYFVQNLVVFDSLVTYISLMITLGYVYFLSEGKQEEVAKDENLNNKEIYTFVIVGAIALAIIYQYNVKPIKMFAGTIQGQLAQNKGITETVETYKKALSYNTVLDRDSKASLINLISPSLAALKSIDPREAEEIIEYVVKLAEENVAYNPKDSLMQLQLAFVTDTAARFYAGNPDRFYFYADRSLEAIEKSAEASPGRIHIYYTKAQVYITRGEYEKAVEELKYAVTLNPDYSDSYCHLARVYLAIDNKIEGYRTMDQCVDLGGVENLKSANYIKNIANYYVSISERIAKGTYPADNLESNTSRLLKLYKRITELEEDNPKAWVSLAKLYADTGQKDRAISAARKAAELDSSLEGAVEEFIRGL